MSDDPRHGLRENATLYFRPRRGGLLILVDGFQTLTQNVFIRLINAFF
jgi:hypothetical protein